MILSPILLLLASSCSASSPAPANEAAEQGGQLTNAADGAYSAPADKAARMAPASGGADRMAMRDECDWSSANPCPIEGRWQIEAVYMPSLPKAEQLSDPNSMKGAVFALPEIGDSGGSLKFEGPDTGQFDVTQQCDMPFISAPDTAVPPRQMESLQKAMAAFKLPAARPEYTRMLACDFGHWATAIDGAGHEAVFTKAAPDRLVISWFEGTYLLARKI
ncbi:hypothetical protein ACFOWX_03555 [Sphingorhabdus arenilitoris]|uniref:Uncharacterized protein n=1 Tax=Sphingorhabdus arenilitoris TaxID=1490041 RepID=A0ABV8RF13_9SPHN